MNYPIQPERLTTRTLTPDEQRDYLERQFENATGFIVGSERFKRLAADELLSAASELLELLRDGYRDDATITAAIERLGDAVNAVTASKTEPSPAGSWRKAGGVLSKSQGQQQ